MITESRGRIASCVCGGLEADCSGEPLSVSLCNCLDCQRRTGSAFGIAALFDEARVQIRGRASCFERLSAGGHEFRFYFCPDCGATVYWQTDRKPGVVAVAAGAFADPRFPAPAQSVFDQHRHPWLDFSWENPRRD